MKTETRMTAERYVWAMIEKHHLVTTPQRVERAVEKVDAALRELWTERAARQGG